MIELNSDKMTQQKNKASEADDPARRNQRRLSTLKLWQSHLQSLSQPKSKPLVQRFDQSNEFKVNHGKPKFK